jgi:RNase H-like domain found in reverse transcriptase
LRIDNLDDLLEETLLENNLAELCFYRSRKLSGAERRYSTIEREMLAFVDTLKVFGHVLRSRSLPIVVITDQANNTQLEKFKVTMGRHFS